jgi:hypothetical protein
MFSPSPKRSGFFVSYGDVIVVVALALGCLPFWKEYRPIVQLIAFGVANFFLFCNVFRIYRNYEYFWGVTYVLNIATNVYLDNFDVRLIMALQIPITVIVIVMQMRTKYYHGIFWERLNPKYAPPAR